LYKNLSLQSLGHKVAFDAACELATRHAFVGVELDVSFLRSLATVGAAHEWFAETGLEPGGYQLRGLWQADQSEQACMDSLTDVVQDAQIAAALGSKRCYTTIPPRHESMDFYQHFDVIVPRLIRIAEVLTTYQIMLGFAFVTARSERPSDQKDFVSSLDGARTLAAAIGMRSMNTGVVLNSNDWLTPESTIDAIGHLDHNEVVAVRLNEHSDRASGLFTALQQIGYLGPVTFDGRCAEPQPSDAVKLASAALDAALGARS
jgi:hypothetical protein